MILLSAEAKIKSQARGILKKNFVKAIIALLIGLLPFYIIDGATTAISCGIINYIADENLAKILVYSIGYPVEIIAGFLFSPLINGYIRAYYRASYTDSIDLKDVFFYFSGGRYGSALLLNIRVFLRMLIPILVLYSPLIIFETVCQLYYTEFIDTILYKDVYFLLAVTSTFTTALYSLRYFTIYTVSADNPQFTTKQVFEYNRYIMRDNTGYPAKMILSFVPWILLCLLVLPMLYVIPYMTQSFCVSAKWLTKAAFEEK